MESDGDTAALLPAIDGDIQHHERRNFMALAADGNFYMLGSAFVDATTVLPLFIGHFSSSPMAVGAMTAIRSAAWMLPQTMVANFLQARARKKPFLVGLLYPTRVSWILFAVAIVLLGRSAPGVLLGGVYLLLIIAAGGEGTASIAYFEVIAKGVRAVNRGKLQAVKQLVGAPAAIAVGLVVRLVLSDRGPGYPWNYGLLFAACGGCLLVGTSTLHLLREPPQAVFGHRVALRRYLGGIPRLLQRNPLVRRLVIVQLLGLFGEMALPFYIVFARQRLGLANGQVGYFVAAEMAGIVVLGLLWGLGADHLGNRVMIRATLGMGALVPTMAFLVSLIGGGQGRAEFFVLLVLFWLIGGVLAWSTRFVYVNLLLEAVTAGQRPTSVGLLNSMIAPSMLGPLLGGAIIGVASFTVLFAVAALFPVMGIAVSFGLPEPRGRPLEEPLPTP